MSDAPRTGAEYLQRLKDDIHFFAEELWRELGLDKVAPLSWVEHDMIEWLAHGDAPRRGILALRGIGKTTFVCIVIAWRLLRNPDRKILPINKAEDDAKKTVGLVRDWIDSVWFLRHLKPQKNVDLDNKDEFNIAGIKPNRQPAVRAIGIDGALPGNRAHTIIPDDIEDRTNTETVESRQKLADRCGEFESILYPDLPASRRGKYDDPTEVLEIGTYHHEDSVYIKEAAKGVVFRVYPIVYPTPVELKAMQHTFHNPATGQDEVRIDLAPILKERLASGKAQPGDIVLPHRFDADNVARKKARGERYFYMQHMLIVGMGTGTVYPLRLKDIMVMDVDSRQAPELVFYGSQDAQGSTDIRDFPCVGFDNDCFRRPASVAATYRPYLSTKMWIDPSGDGKDLTGIAVVSYLNAFLYVQRCEGRPGGYTPQALHGLAQTARETRTREIYIEHNFGGGMFAALFEPVLKSYFLRPGEHPDYPDGWTCVIVRDTKLTHATARKEARIIDTLKPLFEQHRLIFDRRVAMDRALQHQITHITYQKGCLTEYGAIDALEGACRVWDYAMNADPEQKARRQRQDDEDEEERRILAMTPSFLREQRLSRPPNWMDRGRR